MNSPFRYRRFAAAMVASLVFSVMAACSPIPSWFRPEDFFDEPKQVALCRAAFEGRVNEIDRLLKDGAKLDEQGKDGATALWWALQGEQKTAFRRMLELGANANSSASTKSGKKEPIIAVATRMADVSFLQELLAHDADPNSRNRDGDPILFSAVSNRNLAAIELLDKNRADINAKGHFGYTAVSFATSFNYFEGTLRLLELGASYSIKNNAGSDLVGALIQANANLNEDGKRQRQLILDFLAKKGVVVDPNLKFKDGIRNVEDLVRWNARR